HERSRRDCMTLPSLVGHVLELLEQIDTSSQPADSVVAHFLHQKKYIGSNDRRFISGTIFGMIRHRRFLEALLEQYCASFPQHAVLDSPHLRYLPLYVVFASTMAPNAALPDPNWKAYFPDSGPGPFADWVK